MKSARIIGVIVISVLLLIGSAILVVSYRDRAARNYTAPDGGFFLVLPKGCNPPKKYAANERTAWFWFCENNVVVIVVTQPWEDLQKKAASQAEATIGGVSTIDLVEQIAAALAIENFVTSSGPDAICGRAGYFETREYSTSKLLIDGKYKAYYTSPLVGYCGSEPLRVKISTRVMHTFPGGAKAFQLIFTEEFGSKSSDGWTELVQSFHLLLH